MKTLKPTTQTRSVKEARVYRVLVGLVAHYIQTGRPVGSQTLKEAGFDSLSSATLRNYFSQLETEGYLDQMHASGGRLPTEKAYRFYAQELLNQGVSGSVADELPSPHPSDEPVREIARYLQEAAEALSQRCGMAVFLSAPRFDQDFVTDIKVIPIDPHRCLCALITDFGVIQTATLHTREKLSSFAAKRLEQYFHWRLGTLTEEPELEVGEELLAQEMYHEVMVRYLVRYTHFTDEDVYRTGFSRLLAFPEFADLQTLSNTLSLFENVQGMRLLLRSCMASNKLKFWVGSELDQFATLATPAAVISAPYHVHQTVAGAIGILGPMRIPYDRLFGLLEQFTQEISHKLTQSVYKFKIAVRQPAPSNCPQLPAHSNMILLENKSKETDKY